MTSSSVISSTWGEGTMHSRESAILAFLQAGPVAGAKIVLSMEARGQSGPQRFLFDVEGYLSDPVLWRVQARKKDDIRNEELANDRANQEQI